MDVRSIEDVPASPEHQGTVPVWWLFKPREMREETLGGHLELVSEFEVYGGGEVHPHSHPTFEFYYVISGRGLMVIEGETRDYAGRHFCPRCGSSVFARTGDEIELSLGALDAPDQFRPTYELWTIRREAWLPPFPLTRLHERDRDETSRFEP